VGLRLPRARGGQPLHPIYLLDNVFNHGGNIIAARSIALSAALFRDDQVLETPPWYWLFAQFRKTFDVVS